jgi:FSR family fosmidomycin resistance protein-like MFS transporter
MKATRANERTAYRVLLAICFCHMNNDMLQALVIASYPTLKENFHLSFAQIGLVTLAYQVTASLLQPVVGVFSDRRPNPYSLPAGTLFTGAGLVILGTATTFPVLLAGAAVLGIGSSVFHPESSRVARMAAGDRPGLAQSVFQVGGNIGSAIGPLGAAIVVVRWGQRSLGAFALAALVSTGVLAAVGRWAKRELARSTPAPASPQVGGSSGPHAAPAGGATPGLSRARVWSSLAVLLALIFSKFVYLASFSSYYTFYLVHRFGVSVANAQVHLFGISAGVAAGTLIGGWAGDRFGRKRVIWLSILGVLPFTLVLPYVDLGWTTTLTVVIGFVLASAFPAIVVYGQELIPNRVGMVSGLFFGLSFGAAGLGAGLLGKLADADGIESVYRFVSFLPAIGLLAAVLPDLGRRVERRVGARPGTRPGARSGTVQRAGVASADALAEDGVPGTP